MLASDLARALDPVQLMLQAGHDPDRWQAELLRSRPERSLLLCSRQAGKSTVVAAMATHEAVYSPASLILLLSPSLRQSGELFRKVTSTYRSTDQPVRPVHESALQLELENGSRILSLPGKEETVRGFSGVRLLLVDEAARVPDDLYFAVRPMLAVSGGRLVCLSTPFGKRGFFYEEWSNDRKWTRIKVAAHDCPRIRPEFLAEERQALGDWWFRQEYLCDFVETDDQVFSLDHVMAAVSPEIEPLFPGIAA